MKRKMTLNENNIVTPCPKCGNNTSFILINERCAEDLYYIFVECICGFDPTSEDTGWRYEKVIGEGDEDAARVALGCWNDAIEDHAQSIGKVFERVLKNQEEE